MRHSIILAFCLTIAIGNWSLTPAWSYVEPNTDFKPLEHRTLHFLTFKSMQKALYTEHYLEKKINAQSSQQIETLYLDSLDSTHIYLLESDIEQFNRFKPLIDTKNKKANVTLEQAFFIFNRTQQRVSERLNFILQELKKNAKKYDYTIDESIKINQKEAPWAKDKNALNALWKKRLKHEILNLKLSNKKEDDIYPLLKKRYQNRLNRLHQTTSDDAFNIFMNAITHYYDPHTQYLSIKDKENFDINMKLKLEGIGAILKSEDEFTKVVRLIPAGPADKQGQLKPEDRIIGIGQGKKGELVDVIGWRLDEVVDLIRGKKGSIVQLEISNSDITGNNKIIHIVRDEVKLEEQSVQSDAMNITHEKKTHRLGIITIPTFYSDFQAKQSGIPNYKSTTRDVESALKKLMQEGIEGLIIDLRYNGGGSLDEALSLTDLFIDRAPFVQVQYLKRPPYQLPNKKQSIAGKIYKGPLVVLTNRLSASASEIFAGAIQDYKRGLVIGGQTFGKGTVQSIIPLPPSRSQLKITIAKFYRVSGDSTQYKGVIPDIVFPSFFDPKKIGERALENVLPWDRIPPASYSIDSSLKMLSERSLNKLRSKHNTRIAKDPDFIFINDQKELKEKINQRTHISLNEKNRKEENKKNEQQQLIIENKRRRANNEPEFDSFQALKDQNQTKDKEDKNNALIEDYSIMEAGYILLDTIKLLAI